MIPKNKFIIGMITFLAMIIFCNLTASAALDTNKKKPIPSISITDYFPLSNSNTWTYAGEKAGAVSVNGTRVINGVTTICFNWDYNNSTQYYTIDSSGLTNYGTTTIYNGQSYDLIYDTPQLITPQYVEIGKTYTSITTVTDPLTSQQYTFSSSLTIDGYEDITVNGVFFNDALKITETETKIQQSDGLTTISTYDMWYVENLGLVKEYYYDSDQTRYIQSASIYYSSGLPKAWLLAAPDQSGYIYYEYANLELAGPPWTFHITKRQRADGSYDLIEYWNKSDNIRMIYMYDANDTLTSKEFFNNRGVGPQNTELLAKIDVESNINEPQQSGDFVFTSEMRNNAQTEPLTGK